MMKKKIRVFVFLITMALALRIIIVPASSNGQHTEVENVSRTRYSFVEDIRLFQHQVLDGMKHIKEQVDRIKRNQETNIGILGKLESHDNRLKTHIQYLQSKFEPECPAGFHYLPEADGCYVVLFDKLNWLDARRRCQEINPRAHSVVIETQDEDNALRTYLESQRTKNVSSICDFERIWTSGQRITLDSCQAASPQLPPFVWKPFQNSTTIPLNYANWDGGEPNCHGNRQDCLQKYSKYDKSTWDDYQCGYSFCGLCEILPLWN